MTTEQRKQKLTELRLQTGLSRKDFAALYSIPPSTFSQWSYGNGAPESFLKHLERAVNEDFPKQPEEG